MGIVYKKQNGGLLNQMKMWIGNRKRDANNHQEKNPPPKKSEPLSKRKDDKNIHI